MKKDLAVLLIALMATSIISTTGLVTTERVTAAPADPYAVTVPYAKTTTVTLTPTQFNYHNMSKQYDSNDKMPNIQVSSKKSTASESITITKMMSASAAGNASVGARVRITPPAGTTLTGSEPVRATLHATYTISASGNDAHTTVSSGLMVWVPKASISGTAVPHTRTGAFDDVATGPLSWFFKNEETATGTWIGRLIGQAESKVSGVGQASGTIDVSSIDIEFL